MTAVVPSLTGSLYIKDPLSVIAYQLRRFFRMPANTMPLLPDMIISLPYLIAQYGREPENLVNNIQSALQGCLSRVFGDERSISVSCSYTDTHDDSYIVTLSITYAMLNGEINQTGTHIKLVNGRLQIPEDSLINSFLN